MGQKKPVSFIVKTIENKYLHGNLYLNDTCYP